MKCQEIVSSGRNYLNGYFGAKVGKKLPNRFPEPRSVGRQDVGNFALSIL